MTSVAALARSPFGSLAAAPRPPPGRPPTMAALVAPQGTSPTRAACEFGGPRGASRSGRPAVESVGPCGADRPFWWQRAAASIVSVSTPLAPSRELVCTPPTACGAARQQAALEGAGGRKTLRHALLLFRHCARGWLEGSLAHVLGLCALCWADGPRCVIGRACDRSEAEALKTCAAGLRLPRCSLSVGRLCNPAPRVVRGAPARVDGPLLTRTPHLYHPPM